MQSSFNTAGLQDLLLFPVRDADSRRKLLAAAGVNLAGFIIPILPWIFMLGYLGTIMRRIIGGDEHPSMPEWKDWNGFLSLGAKLLGVNFIYALPVFVSMGVGYLLFLLPAFAAEFEGSTRNPDVLLKFMTYSMLGTLGGMALFGIGMLLGLALWLILPAALAHTAASNSFSAGFRAREWWAILKAKRGGFFVTLILMGGLMMMFIMITQAVYMTFVLCFALPFLLAFAGAYISIVIYALFAYAYREGLTKLEAQPAGNDQEFAPSPAL